MSEIEDAYYSGVQDGIRAAAGAAMGDYSPWLARAHQAIADYECALSGAANAAVKLNLGSSDAVLDGYVNVDIVPGPGIEVADLTRPWPWDDSSVDYVRASHVIEHLPDKIFTMNELWRVLKPGARADLSVPTTDGPGAWQDPTHVSFWNRRSFLYYEAGSPYHEWSARSYGITACFRTVRERIDHTFDGPVLAITLEAVKPAPASPAPASSTPALSAPASPPLASPAPASPAPPFPASGAGRTKGRILLATFGSYGDLNPFIGIGRELQRRGFRPAVASNEEWRQHVEGAGLEFRPVRPGWDVRLDPSRQAEILARQGIFTDFAAGVDELMEAAGDADAMVALTLAVAAPLVAGKLGIPWASVVLEPLSFFSAFEPLLPPAGLPLPVLKELVRPWAEPVHQVRRALGLPQGRDPFFEEYLAADAVLAVFSPLLGPPQPDWPPGTVVTGFVHQDAFADVAGLPAHLERFLAAGPPPIVFTLSSDAVNAPADNFYLASVAAARRLGMRAVLAGLPLSDADAGDVLCVNHVPYSALFPKAAAVVHHGGIGTTAIALRAGKPMLVVPGAFAQPDIAARLVRLGVARSLPRFLYTPTVAASTLRTLLGSPVYRARAAEVGAQVSREDGAAAACDAIERLLVRREGGRR